MSKPLTLKQTLSYLQKASLRLDLTDSQRNGVLSALLLSVASASVDPLSSGALQQDLYNATEALLKPELRGTLPLPSQSDYLQAAKLLPAAPHLVADLDDCILAYLYQFFCAPNRARAKALVQSSNKESDLEQLIHFTQLYTPTDVVDFLLQQTVPSECSLSFKLIDPACGAGNFLWRAFELLMDRFVASGCSPRAAAEAILSNCLTGCDIDKIALWICALGIAVRLKRRGLAITNNQLWVECAMELKLEQKEQPLGSLYRLWNSNHALSNKYDAVVGNPPYLGRKLLDRRLKTRLKKEYPRSHSDLCNAFIERGLELLNDSGRLGYITQSSLLYLPTYGDFRKYLIDNFHINTVVEAGSQVFPLQSGEKVNSILLVISKQKSPAPSVFVDLTRDKTTEYGNLLTISTTAKYDCRQQDFLMQRANAFNYRCPPAVLKVRSECAKLEELTEIRQGLATSDNDRFVRFWWQIPPQEIGTTWFPYVKGGGSERWYCPIETLIDWRDGGAELKRAVAENYPYLGGKTAWVVKNERFYFLEGLTFSLVNTKTLSVRYLPPGCIFDVAGSALFPAAKDRLWLLGYLNSSVVAAFALILNPTINYQVGDLKQLPVVSLSKQHKEELASLSEECLDLKRRLFLYHDADRRADLASMPLPSEHSCMQLIAKLRDAQQKLLRNEEQIDRLVFDSLCTGLKLDTTERRSLRLLCDDAVARRKPVSVPVENAEQFARFYIRLSLYETADEYSPPADNWLVQALGMQPIEYIRKQFQQDQLKHLHGTERVRISIDNARVLVKKPYEQALTAASES